MYLTVEGDIMGSKFHALSSFVWDHLIEVGWVDVDALQEEDGGGDDMQRERDKDEERIR